MGFPEKDYMGKFCIGTKFCNEFKIFLLQSKEKITRKLSYFSREIFLNISFVSALLLYRPILFINYSICVAENGRDTI